MASASIQKLIKIFSKFPTVGPRTAARFAYYLLRMPQEEVEDMLKTIQELRARISYCELCFNSFEREGDERICPICRDQRRDQSKIAVVEKEIDLQAIEKTRKYNGLYFILGNTYAGLKSKQDKEKLEERAGYLVKRIQSKNSSIREIILALNPTPEGEETILWIRRKLKPVEPKIKITQLARGLPKGSEMEYADEDTLSSAIDKRG